LLFNERKTWEKMSSKNAEILARHAGSQSPASINIKLAAANVKQIVEATKTNLLAPLGSE
jgi:hypothetical protein